MCNTELTYTQAKEYEGTKYASRRRPKPQRGSAKARKGNTMKNNAYFDELIRIAEEYERRHSAHKVLKEKIIDEAGWLVDVERA